MNPHRRKIYAACTAALLEESSAPGEGTFDAALTNGLLAISSVAIPRHKSANTTGYMPSANKVLDDLVAEFGANEEGVLAAEFDLDFLATHRAAWGFFRDRRTDLYGALAGSRPV